MTTTTNKERIDANNAKIDAIQKTLRNKLSLVNGGVIEIDFPEEFNNTDANVYYIPISRDKIIFTNGYRIGLWLYYPKTNEWKKLNDTGYYLYKFQQVTDTKWLIFGNDDTLVLVFDSTTDSIIQTFNVSGGVGCTVSHIQGTKWLVRKPRYSGPQYVYNSEDDSFKQIYHEGGGSTVIQKISDDEFLLYSPAAGFLVFNVTTDVCELIKKDSSVTRTYIGTVKDRLIFTGYSSGVGVTVFDTTSRSVSVIYETAIGHNTSMGIFGDKLFIGSTNSGYKGIVVYDYATNSVTPFETDGTAYYKYAHQVTDTKIISIGSNKGICYHLDTDTVTDLNLTYYPIEINQSYKLTDTKWLLISDNHSNSNPGVHIYDALDDSLVHPYSYGCSWNILEQVSDDVLLIVNGINRTSNSSNGILKLTLSTNKVIAKTSYGKYNTITKIDDDNYYLTDSQGAVGNRSVIYNVSTDKILFDKFFFEVK